MSGRAVDRDARTESSTRGFGRITHGWNIVTDGTSIFVPAKDGFPNGALRVTHETFDVAQRFDVSA